MPPSGVIRDRTHRSLGLDPINFTWIEHAEHSRHSLERLNASMAKQTKIMPSTVRSPSPAPLKVETAARTHKRLGQLNIVTDAGCHLEDDLR